jgi:hypothetical protein
VTGESFVASSTVNWNGTSRATTEISDTQLTATITAADIAAAGAAQITVINPSPGGGTSNPVGFAINGTRSAATPGFVYPELRCAMLIALEFSESLRMVEDWITRLFVF